MADDNDFVSIQHDQLNRVIAQYLEAAAAGAAPDRERIIKEHPDLAQALRDFFVAHDRAELPPPAARDRVGHANPVESSGSALPEYSYGAATKNGIRRDAPTLPPAPAAGTDRSASTADLDCGAEAPSSADSSTLLVGTPRATPSRFGDYELLAEVARGGMGVVYKARQVSLNRIVAVKMILAGQLAGPEEVKRFQAEAEAAANLDHPGIVPIHEVGCHAGQHYFSMGYVEGPSLAKRLTEGPLTPCRSAALVRHVAEAVHYAHGHGIIHRDLKPANILLDESRDEPMHGTVTDQSTRRTPCSDSQVSMLGARPRITDFGLAKRVAGDCRLTTSGAVLGTPSFMPPEQASGKLDQISALSDIYALGAILYTCLIGCPPFEADTPLDTVMQVLESEPVAPRRLQRSIPRALETITLKCLEKNPGRRYATAQHLADDLGRFLSGEPISARPLGLFGRVQRWARRFPALAVTMVALILFYTNHLINMFVLRSPDETWDFHRFTSGLLLVWLSGAVTFQYLARRFRARNIAIYGWAGMDVLLFTAFLSVANGPCSTVIMGYLLLVAGAALRFQNGLVWFVAVLSVTGYVGLVLDARWFRPEHAVANGAVLPFVLSLLLMAIVMHFMSRRVRPTELTEPGTMS